MPDDFNLDDLSLDAVQPVIQANDLDKAFREGVDKPEKKFSHAEMQYLLALHQAWLKRTEDGTEKWFRPGTAYGIEKCPKHAAFFRAGKLYRQRIFMAGNRVGKTVGGALEMAFHLTGKYPAWWEGKRFDKAIEAWACGKTGQTTRDTVQKELLGGLNAQGTGTIPKEDIVKTFARPGIPNGIDSVVVKHVSGKESLLGFKSYDQMMPAFYGTARHVVWFDEEPPDDIYNEGLLRTMTTNGIVYITVTPLAGLTPLIFNFCKDADYLEGSTPILSSESFKLQWEELNGPN